MSSSDDMEKMYPDRPVTHSLCAVTKAVWRSLYSFYLGNELPQSHMILSCIMLKVLVYNIIIIKKE